MTLIRSPGPSGRRRLCSTATRRLIGAAAISAIVVPQSLAQDSRTTAEIAAIAMRSTATIIALGSSGDTLGQGSGFVVRSDGVVVTNWHVVAGARRVVVILADQSPIEDVGALAGDSVLDLALLKLPGTGYEALGTDSLPRVGERVVVIGSPLGLSQTVSEGIVSAIRETAGHKILQMSAPISPGSSGGPVLNDRGAVVAIATGHLTGGQQLNFAIPVLEAIRLLELSGPPVPLATMFGLPANAAGIMVPTTANLRDAYVGAFSVRWGLDRTFSAPGLLVLDPEGVGLIRFNWEASTWAGNPKVDMGAVSRLITGRVVSAVVTTSPTGQVLLDAGGGIGVLDGYQTDDGFAVRDARRTTEMAQYILQARDTMLALSHADGLYRATARLREGGIAAVARDWSGWLAVVTTDDSLFVSGHLADSESESIIGLGMSGPLQQNGSFDVSFELGFLGAGRTTLPRTALRGVVAVGKLQGDLTLGNLLSGTLEARRR